MTDKRKSLRRSREPLRMLTPRVTKSQAEALAEEANRFGASLNALYVYRLTCPLRASGFETFLKETGQQTKAELTAPAKCARTMCSNPHDDCRHTIDTDRLYCWECAQKINDHHPRYTEGLITIPDTARQSYFNHLRTAAT